MAMEILLQNKRKFFFWLILQDRLNTRALLKRKHMSLLNYHCVLCNLGVDEDIFHLLFHSFLYGLLVYRTVNYPQLSRYGFFTWEHQRSTAFSFSIHTEILNNNVLVYLVNAQRCDFQKSTSFSQQMQASLQEEVCSYYSLSKDKIPISYRFMATVICISLLFMIFFLTFFVSWL
jgi:hypothetical protein